MKLKVNAVFDDVKENVRRDIGEIFEATATRFKELEKSSLALLKNWRVTKKNRRSLWLTLKLGPLITSVHLNKE
ncbi:hypothetical protein OBG91_07575 [Lactococcus lactis]|nr:hypothetical protein [Lactococcus lactis]